MPSGSSSSAEPKRILVRGVNWLGDAVMSTPALQRLRERFPKARISLLTPEKLADLWLDYPHLDEMIPFAAGSNPWTVARRIRARCMVEGEVAALPDLALVFPNSPRSALEMWLARIPRRIGYVRPWRNWLLTQGIPPKPGPVRMQKLARWQVHQLVRSPPSIPHPSLGAEPADHQIHEYLRLAAALGADPTPVAPRLEVKPEDTAVAARHLEELANASFPAPQRGWQWLGVNPAAAYGPAKRWPAKDFAAAMRAVSARWPDALWLLFGSAVDEPLCGQIACQAGGRVLNLAGKTSLRELMARLAQCQVLLTNDSGPMHLAAAVGTPVVALFGSTAPALTGPGLPGDPQHRLLQAGAACAPCFRRTCPIDLRCLTGITVDRVVAAVLEVGGGGSSS